MTRSKFVALYLEPSTASTVATRRASAEDKRKALPDGRVDFHVDAKTSQE